MNARSRLSLCLVTALLFSASLLSGQAQRGTVVHEETIRISPNGDAARVGQAARGNELVILETSRDWVHVQAILREARNEEGLTDDEAEAKTVTGWIAAKGMVSMTTQDGDRIIFGEAADARQFAPPFTRVSSATAPFPAGR